MLAVGPDVCSTVRSDRFLTMRRDTTDLGAVLIAATLLLVSAGYLAQCGSTQRPAPPQEVTAATPSAATEHKRKSIEESANEEDREESQRIKDVAHALQTIGANPEMRKTYGFPP